MNREQFFQELRTALHREGFTPQPEQDELLPVGWDGLPLCRITADGGVRYWQEDVATPERERACERATDLACTVREYMTLLEQAPPLQAQSLTGDYRLLADFNGAVLAAHPTRLGVQFVTWDWSFDRTGLNQGNYFQENYAGAKQDFAIRAGLISKQQIFNQEQLSVTIRGNEWYDHAEERGGHAVSFVQRFYHLSYPEAVTMLLGGELGTVYPSAEERVEEPPKPFVLPPANSNMRRVYAYLVKHRNIDRSVVAHFAREKLLYEDADYHNAVFVGTDEDGVPRHAHKRSANSFGKAFRLNVEGCDPRHSFHHIGTDGSLYVFEAPIDMLSYITLHPEGWQSHSYVACCGTSIQPVLKLLERQPQINTVLLCLDNDEAGHLASRRMKEQLAERYTVERLIPAHKDWNDDLTAEEPSYAQVMQ